MNRRQAIDTIIKFCPFADRLWLTTAKTHKLIATAIALMQKRTVVHPVC